MTLSAPLYVLKRRAKELSRAAQIPLHQALDRIAVKEGFARWSLLMAKAGAQLSPATLFARLAPGDLLLLGARPFEGKTTMSLRLAVEAMKAGRRAVFFTLEYPEREVPERLRVLGEDPEHFGALFDFDCSDAISAATIMARLDSAPPGTLAVIDYLQLLDQRRDNPSLMAQVRTLKAFARDRGLTIVFLSQIDRSYDPAQKSCPDLADVRLPNPLDLGLFDKTCFLNGDEVRFSAAG